MYAMVKFNTFRVIQGIIFRKYECKLYY